MKGCGQKIHWRPGYGKDRILNHVRTHWGKPTKKCKLCDFKATHAHKVSLCSLPHFYCFLGLFFCGCSGLL
ncbi:hypothetical protein ANCDUO_26995 [Ancylostoma duodenale]|uniref:Zinc finger, C2H2 type n=1 Tax=Ancylostoma duodenale TaxID=51022 RepID=A0A0C2BGY3_9BILA|nr:hypothetical protein ANCDUO_26995 [Ancylostoma duodenale]